MKQRIQDIISQLTLEEKASLCSGENNWSSKAIERLGIPSLYMTDGPHGLRKEADDGFGNSKPATCFPTAACLASSWNADLVEKVGQAIGKECQAYGVQIILGPGANIKRSPLNGRNFEYFSEDPMVSGKMAAALINGVQSEGVGTSLKHFVANNQEFERMSINAEVDERALREIYLAGFEIAVKESQPDTMMCAYNKVNGEFASEHKYLLYDILKTEWNYEGIVMSDWSAVHHRPSGVEAGLHLEMPGNGGVNDKKIVKAVQDGTLSEERLDEVVGEWLSIILKLGESKGKYASFDENEHHKIAQEASAEGIVLLKNDNNILPLTNDKKIAVIGQFAKTPRFQGSGSSLVLPTMSDNAYDELVKIVGAKNIAFANGYDKAHLTNSDLLKEATETAKNAEKVILFIGLPEAFESEGTDRKHINLPESHNQLVDAILKVQKNVVVVLFSGSPVAMPWKNEVTAIMEGWLGGQGGGKAIADVLTGQINPSGKLTETFPIRLEDSPSYLHFPGTTTTVRYGESIFVGYRHFDKKRVETLFPFGHGLSYTSFEYSNITINKSTFSDKETVKLSVDIKNTGNLNGKEIVQLYVADIDSTTIRPDKELKGFTKVTLNANETKTVHFELNRRDFAFYDEETSSWKVETGQFEILIGASSTDIRQSTTIEINEVNNKERKLTKYSTCKEFLAHPIGKELVQPIYDMMIQLMSRSVPDDQPERKKEIVQFFVYIMNDLPLYKLPTQSNGQVGQEVVDEILAKI